MSVGACLDPATGALLPGSVEVVPSRVAPARRLTYESVDEILEHADAGLEPDVFALQQVRGRVEGRASAQSSSGYAATRLAGRGARGGNLQG